MRRYHQTKLCIKLAKVLDLDETKLLLLAYKERSSGPARKLFEQINRIMNDPIVEYLLSQKEILDPQILEALKEPDIRDALKNSKWRKVFLKSYQMEDKDIPILIETVEKMNDRQWGAMLNMMEVLTQGS